MKKVLLYLKVVLRRLSNPVFLVLLLLSFVLWYVVKLSYTYTTYINIPVYVDDVRYNVRTNVEGNGYQILLQNIAPRRNSVELSSEDLDLTPSALYPDMYEVPPLVLQNQISSKITELKIISVETSVDIYISDGGDEEDFLQ